MILNYLTITIRNCLREWLYTCIIIIGLASGITCTLIIAQYIQFEQSFDSNIQDKDRIYYAYLNWNADKEVNGKCFAAIAPFCKRTIPEVDVAVRIAHIALGQGTSFALRREEDGKRNFYSQYDNLLLADPEVLSLFSIEMISGDHKALTAANTIVITKALAEKFFPGEDPLNHVLTLQFGEFAKIESRITGITENPSPNSSLQFDALFSMATLPKEWDLDNLWMLGEFQTFIKFHKGADDRLVEKKINETATPIRKLEENLKSKITVHLFPFEEFHFFKHINSSTQGTIQFTGDKRLMVYFAILAALILTISWSNYINLTTARALRRAKEVGLRKVSGASRANLISQFLTESLLLNLISILLSVTLAQMLFPVFARIIGSNASWIFWSSPSFWVMIVFLLALSTLMSGIYPAFIMSDYKPVKILKGSFSNSHSGIMVRKGLVLVQFGLSVFMIMSIYVISRQLFFMQKKDLGMSTDQVIVIRTNELDTAINRGTAFLRWRSKMKTIGEVKTMYGTDSYPGENKLRSNIFYLTSEMDKKSHELLTNELSGDYMNTLGLELRAGSDFIDSPADSNKAMINETAAIQLGFSDPTAAIGEEIMHAESHRKFKVIGIVKDFNFNLKIPLAGEIFTKRPFYQPEIAYTFFVVKLSTTDIRATVSQMENEWKTLFSQAPFDYFFLDTYFDTFYRQEQMFAGVFGFFAIIGIILACMGLFGLSSYNTHSRIKEIGIRKSLGASIKGIMWQFSKEYLKLVLLAAMISIPVCVLVIKEWLNIYPYHIGIEADIVLLPLIIMLCIAMLTVGYHTFKTASMDPVKSLRNE